MNLRFTLCFMGRPVSWLANCRISSTERNSAFACALVMGFDDSMDGVWGCTGGDGGGWASVGVAGFGCSWTGAASCALLLLKNSARHRKSTAKGFRQDFSSSAIRTLSIHDSTSSKADGYWRVSSLTRYDADSTTLKEDFALIRRFRCIAVLICLSSLVLLVSLQNAPPPSTRTQEQRDSYRKTMETADQQIADEVKAHSELMKNLEYLTTQIGPRLTGSPQMQQASEWTLKRFQDYGVEAHLETAEIEHAWTRGVETAEIESPIHRSIGIRALGWSKATNGEVSGKAVALDLRKPSDLDAYKGKLKGAIVLAR